mmetsp:Transcript_58547/g.139362  ORF Transcript_58547/g.139362 Transcript_58547/m.139362 type:complete len:247 (+) Transcript_58547:2364-3104(+)
MVHRLRHRQRAPLHRPQGGRQEGQAGRGRCRCPGCHCQPPSEEEGEDLRVRGEVAVQEHGPEHLGGEGHLGEDGVPEAGPARGRAPGRHGGADDQAAHAARGGEAPVRLRGGPRERLPHPDQPAQRRHEGQGGAGRRDVAEPPRADPGRAHQLPGPRGSGRADLGHQGLQGRRADHLPQQGVLRQRGHGEVDHAGRAAPHRGRVRGHLQGRRHGLRGPRRGLRWRGQQDRGEEERDHDGKGQEEGH